MKSVTNSNIPILFYDSQCKFCSKTKSFLSRIDSRNTKFYPLTSKKIVRFQNELYISKNTAQNVMYYKNKEGAVSFGSTAFFEYLKDKNGVLYLLGIAGGFPPLNWFYSKLYSCIALHRYIISKLF